MTEVLKPSLSAFITNYFLIALVVIFLLLFFGLHLSKTINFIATVVSLLLIFYLIDEPLYKRVNFTYEISEDSVIEKSGIFTKKQKTVPFRTISEVLLVKNPLGRIFNYGDIKVAAFNGSITLFGIRHPERVYQIIKSKIGKEHS